jgi:hypothetical protein
MSWLPWTYGREAGGYKLLTLIKRWKFFPADLHIIKYEEGSHILPHIDVVEGKKHYRFNFVFYKRGGGGNFKCAETIFSNNRLALFRPDLYTHWVTPVETNGVRYVLSMGITI